MIKNFLKRNGSMEQLLVRSVSNETGKIGIFTVLILSAQLNVLWAGYIKLLMKLTYKPMNKYIRSYPHTNDWKARTYEPEIQTSHIVVGVMILIAVVLQLNAIL